MTYPKNDRDRDASSNRGGYPSDNRGGDSRGAAPPAPAPRDDGPAIPEGEYPVKAVAHRIGLAGTGTEQIGIRLVITEGQFKNNRSLVWYGFFTDAGTETTIKAMRALGFRGDDVRKAESLYDGQATAVVEHEPDRDGKPRARVRWLNGADVAMKEEFDKGQLDAFAAKMRGAFARMPGGGVATKPPEERGRDDRGPAQTAQNQRGTAQNGRGPAQSSQQNFGRGDGRNAPAPIDDDRPPYDR